VRALLLITVLTGVVYADAQEPESVPTAETDKKIAAVRITTPPKIDGKLDDAVWQQVPVDDRFSQIQPLEHHAPTEKTDLQVAYDDDSIYFAFRCWDDQPSKIVSRLTRRDRDVEADWVGVLIDSRHDRSSGFAFRVNVANVQLDALWYGDTNQSSDWDAVWESATSRDDKGWTAELRIPLSALRFSSANTQEWGFDAARYISRNKEMDFWSFIPTTAAGFVSVMGTMTGLEGLHPRRTFELRPYAAARVTSTTTSGGALLGLDPGGGAATPTIEAGLDLKLGVTSDLTLDATVNPDFGQVEADQVILNLSRFEAYFPEKRPFFLEGTDLFDTPAFNMFYTRRIGQLPVEVAAGDGIVGPMGKPLLVDDTDSSVRIWSAAKLAGKVADKLQIGAVEAVTGAQSVTAEGTDGSHQSVTLSPLRNFSVARARYDFGGASYVGAMATAVDRLGGHVYSAEHDHDAYTQGLDGMWVIDPEHWRVRGQVALSEKLGGTGWQTRDGTPCDPAVRSDCIPLTRQDGTMEKPGALGWAFCGQFNGNYRHWNAHGEYRAMSPDLDLNDLGYAPNFNMHQLNTFGGYQQPVPHGIFRSWGWWGGQGERFSMQGVLVDAWAATGVDLSFMNYLNMGLEFDTPTTPRIWDIYETYDGSPYEKQEMFNWQGYFNTDSRKAVILSGFAHYGWNQLGEHDVAANANVAFQLIPQLELSLSPSVEDSKLLRFYQCTDPTGQSCTVLTDLRRYMFANQDATFVSLTGRATWTFSPRMSLQAYAQLFADRGSFSGYRTIDTMGGRPVIHRGDMMTSTFNGDNDGDGVKDDDFQDLSLNVNIVLRWEFRPGSELLGVFTRAENAAFNLMGHSPAVHLGGLSSGPTEDVLLVKFVYFLG
jgi:hypothetical protein